MYREKGSVVKVFHEEGSNDVNLIYIQLPEQMALYKKYGEVILLDATYKVNKLAMSLFTLLVVDNFGVGQPVAYFFVKNEDTENVTAGLKVFAEVIFFCIIHLPDTI